MFERYTERARRVTVLAQEEARLLNHNFIDTEHLLLGLIREGEGVAAKALEQLGISLEAVREKVEETMGAPSTAAGGSPPFTPRAKKVLELSLREALQLGHNYIGTEHILLGLVREGEGAARVLVDLGADLSRVREQVIQLLSGYGSQGKEATDHRRGGPVTNDDNEYEALRRRWAILAQVCDFTLAIDGLTGVDGVLSETVESARRVLGAKSSELWLRQGTVWLHYSSTAEGPQLRMHEEPPRLERLALRNRRGLLLRPSQPSEHVDRAALGDRDGDDAVAVPFQNPELEGVLTVAGHENALTTFNEDDLNALTSMAAHAGVALVSAFLWEKLAKEEEEKQYLALHDSLTGLPNRTLFAAEVEASCALRGTENAPQAVAVMLLDLDSFKEVNHTLGHGVGDVVLKVIASRLIAAIGGRDKVARLGGDEYAVIVRVEDRDGAMREAQAVKRCVEVPIDDQEGLLIEPRASIGVAMSPEHGDDASTLLRLADVAMYSAKEHRTGITFYEAEHDHYSPRRLTLAGELRQAMAAGELRVTYQPQQDLVTGAITAVEALVQWNHKVHGFIPPEEFMPVAEQTGLIDQLTDYVLTEALSQQVRWARQGLDLEVAVNLSPRVLQDGQLPSIVAQRLAETESEAPRLTLELSETGLATDHARVAAALHQLATMGVRISIDNFGTGYSSVSRLSDLPVKEVKIDKSFVSAMANGAPETVVRSIIDLGHSLSLRVIAQGVDDIGTLPRLRHLHCDAVQGDVLSQAVAADVLEAWLADQNVGMPAEQVIVPLRPAPQPTSASPDSLFEVFTAGARRVIVLAQAEARLLGHALIGTEHLLLGLIHEGESVAADTLAQLGISLEAVRRKVTDTSSPSAPALTRESPPFTPRAKTVMNLSLTEAIRLGHHYIGPEDLLLGIVREGQGVGAHVLVDLGADLSQVRRLVVSRVSGHGTTAEVIGDPIPACPGCRRRLQELTRTVVSSTAIGRDADSAQEVVVMIVSCPYCSIVLGLIPSGE
jgi:diguanylate cyclase (GGDEF)-like protein